MVKTSNNLNIRLQNSRTDRRPLDLLKHSQPKEKNLRIAGGRVCKVRFSRLLTHPPGLIVLLCVAIRFRPSQPPTARFEKKSDPAIPIEKCGTAHGRLLREDYTSAECSLVMPRTRPLTRRAESRHSLQVQVEIASTARADIQIAAG